MTAVRAPRAWRQELDLVVALVARDVTLRYRRSGLGILWSQAGPVVMLAVLTFVFTRVVPLSIPDYAAFVLIGLLAWTWFSGAITAATVSVSDSADLVRRPGFAVALLPLVSVGTHLIQLLLALPVLALATGLSTGRVPVTVVALPAVMAVQALVMLGPAWVLAAANVRYRDVSHLVGVLLLPLFYVTPVFYDAAVAPERLEVLYRLNPLVHLLDAYRDCALHGRWPSAGALLAMAAGGALVGWLGLRTFESQAGTFPDHL